MLFSSSLRNSKRSAQRAGFRSPLESLEIRRLFSSAIVQTNLVSDDTQVTPAQVQDANLVNPWGLAASPTGEWWVANEGTGTSTLYDTSHPQATVDPLVVDIPASTDANPFPLPHSPTGIVFHDPTAGGFDLTPGNDSTSSKFVFATLDGTISGWNRALPDLNNAVVMAQSPSALYTGLAIGTGSQGQMLYAADFANGKIDVYDQNFQAVANAVGNFTDSELPDGYHPFNIQAINNQFYVEYAPVSKILAGKANQGDGAVDVYSADGKLQQRLIRHGHLDQPWAIALAPANFGSFSNDLLVGNFGDGHINAFDPKNGHFDGELRDANGQPIAITHLWGLAFGNGGQAGPTNTLYFTAGLTSHLAPSDNPFHGLFGSLQVATHRERDSASIVSSPKMPTSTMSSLNGVFAQQIDTIFQERNRGVLGVVDFIF